MILARNSIIIGVSLITVILGVSIFFIASNANIVYGQFFGNGEQNDSENNSANTSSLDEQLDSDNAYIVLTSQKLKKESYGYRDLVGQVKNIGNGTADFVKISMNFYDKSGDLLTTENVFADPYTLKPSQKAPFSNMIAKDDIKGMDYYEIGLQWNNPDGTKGYIESVQLYKEK